MPFVYWNCSMQWHLVYKCASGNLIFNNYEQHASHFDSQNYALFQLGCKFELSIFPLYMKEFILVLDRTNIFDVQFCVPGAPVWYLCFKGFMLSTNIIANFYYQLLFLYVKQFLCQLHFLVKTTKYRSIRYKMSKHAVSIYIIVLSCGFKDVKS